LAGLTFFVTAATSALLALVLVDLAGLAGPLRSRASAPTCRRRAPVPAAIAVPLVAIVAGLAISLGLLHGAGVEDRVAVIAHRGASAIAPENSLAAIEAAVAAGADWVEIDVQETADGTVLVAHDRDFMKIAGVPLAIHEATMTNVAGIDIGSGFGPAFSGERAPTLAQALDAIRGRSRLLIELKFHGFQDRLEERVAAVVDRAGMAGEVAVMSLDPDGLARMRALRPDWQAGAVVATTIGDRTALGGDFLAVRAATVNRRLLRRAGAAGIQVYAWTVNDPLEMSRLASLGIDGLITDDPALARQVLENRAGIGLPGRLLLHAAAVIGVQVGAAPPAEQRP
jgi:glycerophosphoryl diester phosphodiesterase